MTKLYYEKLLLSFFKYGLSVLVSLFISIFYYFNYGYFFHDDYSLFIFGDLINSDINKTPDVKVSLIFFLSFICCLLLLKKIDGNKIVEFSKVFRVRFLYVIPYVLTLLYSFLSIRLITTILGYNIHWGVECLSTLFLLIVCFLSRSKLYFSQALLSLSPLLYLSNNYLYAGKVINFTNTISLDILLYILTLVIFVITILEYKKKSYQYFSYSSLVFFLILTLGKFTFVYSLDEYHMGELFTSFHQLYDFASKSYVDYIPTKGYMQVVIGYVNDVFFHGDYLSLMPAIIVSNIIFIVLLTIVLKLRLSNFYILLLYIIGLPIIGDNFTGQYSLILPSIIALDYLYRKVNIALFLVFYFIINYLYFVYYNAFALAFFMATIPAVLYLTYKNRIKCYKSIRMKSTIILIFSFLLILILNYDYILKSLIYVLSNSKSNLLYWGNYGDVKYFLMSNLWIVPCSIFIFLLINRKLQFNERNVIWISYLVISPFVLLGYMEGRADITYVRAHYFTIVYLNVLIASIIMLWAKNDVRIKLMAIFLIMVSFIYYGKYIKFNPISNLDSYSITRIPDNLKYIKHSEIPKLGQGFILNERYDDLYKEYNLFKKLKENETFLIIDDYVTQSARYSIFNKKIPTISHSVLNISSIREQISELDKISRSNVEIVRISSGLKRYQLIYKYFIDKENYNVYAYDNKHYLISDEYFRRLDKLDIVKDEHYLESLSTNEFGLLPIKWGEALHNEVNILKKHNLNFNYKIANDFSSSLNEIIGNDPYFIYEFVGENIKGSSIDLINIKFPGKLKGQCRGQLFWSVSNTFRESDSVRFYFSGGNNIIPLSMNFNWLRGDIKYLRFDVDSCFSEVNSKATFSFYSYK
ncbi:hypothetical protein [Photobacterium leiognathi]|uniref:hypothetical protein n=1 Tax=Photobacterium leiognathi TaxID=553611 RepID=UPI0029817443|nr:hypothetical protein [Photobacterium leiognathi]